MLKSVESLGLPDPYFAGTAGFVGTKLEGLHSHVSGLKLPDSVPEDVRRCHDGIRHAYIYSFYSYDLLTLAAAQTFPCLELALRHRVGAPFEGRVDRKGRPRPAMLGELLDVAKQQGLIDQDTSLITHMRNKFAHGSDMVLNPPLFLGPFEAVTSMIRDLFERNRTIR